MTTSILLLLIYGLILNLNEFSLAAAANEEREGGKSHYLSKPTTTTEKKEEEEDGTSALTILYVLIGLGIVIIIGLGITGYIVYLKCYKKPSKPTTPEKLEATPPHKTDVVNHSSTYCEASTLAPSVVEPDVVVIGGESGGNNSNGAGAAVVKD